MSIYKITGISAVIAFLCMLTALILNPMSPSKGINYTSPAGTISLIIALITFVVFIILLLITFIKHKVEMIWTHGLDTEKNSIMHNILCRSGRYDEKSDPAELRRKAEKEKRKLD